MLMGAFPINGSKHLYTNKIESNFWYRKHGYDGNKKYWNIWLQINCDVESC
jgi:hypothetical protein